MPTGYTAKLEESNWNLKKWLTEDLVRGLGVCVMFRDNGDMTQKQILEGLVKETFPANNYNYQQLKNAEAKLKQFKARSKDEWKKIKEKETQETKISYENNLEEVARKSTAYNKVVRELKYLQDSSKTEAIQSITKYGLDQLFMVRDEFVPSEWLKESYDRIKAMSLKDFIKQQIDYVKRDIQYYKDRIKENKNEDNRLNFYVELINEVDKYL